MAARGRTTTSYLDAICFLLIAAGLRIGCLMHHCEERLGIRPNPYGYTKLRHDRNAD